MKPCYKDNIIYKPSGDTAYPYTSLTSQLREAKVVIPILLVFDILAAYIPITFESMFYFVAKTQPSSKA